MPGSPGQCHSLVGLVAVPNFDAALDEAHHVLILQEGEMLRAGPGWGARGLRKIVQGSGPCLPLPGSCFYQGSWGDGVRGQPYQASLPLGLMLRVLLAKQDLRDAQPHMYKDYVLGWRKARSGHSHGSQCLL